ncbi:MAG: transcription termination factor NusA [Alphaproteobacteria bacterium]
MRAEILQVADVVAREKGIDREIVMEAMEEAVQRIGKSTYGPEKDIRAEVDRKSGEIKITRHREVVADIAALEDDQTQIMLEDAKEINADVEVGQFLIDHLPPIEFGRVGAQLAKQTINQKIREAERARQYEEFKDRVGEVINGTVKRAEYGNVYVDLGRAEGIMRRDESIPREHFKVNDRIRCYIYNVSEEQRGPQIFLSRTHPEFMKALFKQEVPEVYEGTVEIVGCARDPGSRAKIAVISHDAGIDPVGACVGMRGSRVQAVVGELQGEKVDIIPWSPDTANFIVNALAPAEVSKVVVDEVAKRLDVVVPEDQQSLAIGRRGQNVRLASILTGWQIDIMTEEQEQERRAAELAERSELFMEALDVDEVIGQLLVAEGFRSVDELAWAELDELAHIEGFDEDIAEELSNRAKGYLEALENHYKGIIEEKGVNEDLMSIEGLSLEMAAKLAQDDVLSLEDFAGLAGDELREIIGEDAVTDEEANNIIMATRQHLGWFDDEETEEGDAESEEADASDAPVA